MAPTSAPGPVPLIIDTDGGVDDAVALFWAATSPDVELVAVTVVHGNVPLDVAATNVCTVLEAAGRHEVAIAVGVDEAIGPIPPLRPATFIHGTDGLGDTGRRPTRTWQIADDACGVLAERCAERPGELTLATLGPLSNVALALRRQPELAAHVRRLVVMGGAAATQGNALPGAEANIAHDPTAAAEVAVAPWTMPPLLVGLDVTHQATITTELVELLAEERTPAARFLRAPLDFYRRAAGTFCAPGEFPCHDLLATLAAVHPVVDGPVLPMAVQDQPGPAWGATVVDWRVPFFERAGSGSAQSTTAGFAPWQIGTRVDVAAFRDSLGALFGG